MKRFIGVIVLLTSVGCYKAPEKQCWDCIQTITKLEGVKETKRTANQEFCSATSRLFFEDTGTYYRNLGTYTESSSVRCTLK